MMVIIIIIIIFYHNNKISTEYYDFTDLLSTSVCDRSCTRLSLPGGWLEGLYDYAIRQ